MFFYWFLKKVFPVTSGIWVSVLTITFLKIISSANFEIQVENIR